MMMKIKTFFSFLLAAAFFDACAPGDIASENDDSNSSGRLVLNAGLDGSSSRVSETADATTNILTTTWQTGDKLNVYHKYLDKAGTALSSNTAFTFVNTSADGAATGTFKSEGFNNYNLYTFNNGQKLYSFNVLPTAGNYTQTANTDGTFALTLSNFDQQDGTLANLGKWDAMYGSATATGATTADNTTMKHLCSAVCIKLTNSAFSDGSTVSSITFGCSSASTSILPSSGTFTLGSDGATLTAGTLTGATSWTASNVPISGTTATVYLMTFPLSSVTGTLTATYTYNGTSYTTHISYSSLSLTRAKVKVLSTSTAYNVANFYEWDAYYQYPSSYNSITSGVAQYSCASCPTVDEMEHYLGAGVYWDDTQTWTNSSGVQKTCGLWLKKKAYWGSVSGSSVVTPTSGRPKDTSEYFFLPAAGYLNSGTLLVEGGLGYYWLSTPYSTTSYAYFLNFGLSTAGVCYDKRSYGFCLWSAQ